ncbi:MAG: hypothetical protein KBS81_08680, partial [Spirochaetales bacterium]|nr:hypothetical protein [Candidatus Physcosoma equi]
VVHPPQSARSMEILKEVLAQDADDDMAAVAFQREMVSKIAKIFMEVYEKTNGEYGYVSIQGTPFDESYDTIMKLAHYNREAGPNIMIKIPATDDGIKAIEQCVAEGIPVNCTEVMSMDQVNDVLDAYDRGVARAGGKAPVAYISHITGIFDEYLTKKAAADGIEVSREALHLASKAMAQKVRHYMDMRSTKMRLINGGARGLNHFTEWVGCEVSTTINWLGTAGKLLEADLPVVERFNNPVELDLIDELYNKFEDFRKGYFTNGLKPEEYHDYGPVELFCSSFRGHWKKELEIIKNERNK